MNRLGGVGGGWTGGAAIGVWATEGNGRAVKTSANATAVTQARRRLRSLTKLRPRKGFAASYRKNRVMK